MAKVKTPYIGIGITTHNRYEIFKHTLEIITKFAPAKAKIVVVDDASDMPVKEATFRFEKNVGIAPAKNKCLELLEDCEHIFLFDDDIYPKCKDWWVPYVNSPEKHLCYSLQFNKAAQLEALETNIFYNDGIHKAFSYPNGAMLYFDRECLEKVGGFDWRFYKWGGEHENISDRIFHAGLTSFRYMDIVGSNKLIHAMDEFEEDLKTTTKAFRTECCERNSKHYIANQGKTYFVDYREKKSLQAPDEGVVITTYFNGAEDPQRKKKWEADANALKPLIDSIAEKGKGKITLVVITDCIDKIDHPNVIIEKVEKSNFNPYYLRWVKIRKWLLQHPEVERAWHVDATDVELINNPFPQMEIGTLYTGDENNILADQWLLNATPSDWLKSYFLTNPLEVLLNCGLIGGDRETLIELFTEIIKELENNIRQVAYHGGSPIGAMDMGIFNYIVRTKFKAILKHGRLVNTLFKAYQSTDGALSWWKHK